MGTNQRLGDESPPMHVVRSDMPRWIKFERASCVRRRAQRLKTLCTPFFATVATSCPLKLYACLSSMDIVVDSGLALPANGITGSIPASLSGMSSLTYVSNYHPIFYVFSSQRKTLLPERCVK